MKLEPPELGQVQIRIDRPADDAPARIAITVERPERCNCSCAISRSCSARLTWPACRRKAAPSASMSPRQNQRRAARQPSRRRPPVPHPRWVETSPTVHRRGRNGQHSPIRSRPPRVSRTITKPSRPFRSRRRAGCAPASTSRPERSTSHEPRICNRTTEQRGRRAAATASSTSSTASQTGNTALTSLSSNFNDFLKMLMTQLQNQDPTSPMDTNQFTSELVQFSSVEQQINTNTSLTQLIQLTQAGEVMQASAMTGKKVTVSSDHVPLQNGQGPSSSRRRRRSRSTSRSTTPTATS